jgi:hypothetical protein
MLKYGPRPCQKSPDTENQGQSSHILVILNQTWVLGDLNLCNFMTAFNKNLYIFKICIASASTGKKKI